MHCKVTILALLASSALAIPQSAAYGHNPTSAPTVSLGYGSFQGITSGNITTFLGMPFAAPPVGQLRFAPPHPPLAFTSVRQATAFGAACIQTAPLALTLPTLNVSFGPPITNVSEDCLFVNVVRPAAVAAGKKLPVVFWIVGGAFQIGDSSQNPGNPVVQRSIALGEPVIYVSANYRLNAFGFLAGKEVKAAGLGNVGLRDQRFALEWIQQHIAAFGGDPRKVTIWGESAGAMSVGLQLVANNGNHAGLFRGAFMESGSPPALQDITARQPSYDALVAATGCQGAADTLACLRLVPAAALIAAVNNVTTAIVQLASVDGVFITRNPQDSIAKGLYARVPLVTGDCDDEGTLFLSGALSTTTNQEFVGFLQEVAFPGASAAQIDAVAQAYPDNVTLGSPFDTGTANAITPEFKRIAAFEGDIMFQAPRRFLLKAASKTQNTWAFLWKRNKATPVIGSYHTSDIPEFYGIGASPDFIGTDALVNFVNNLDPNVPKHPQSRLSAIEWPQWRTSATAPPLLTFLDPAPAIAITADNYRADAMDVITQLGRQIDG